MWFPLTEKLISPIDEPDKKFLRRIAKPGENQYEFDEFDCPIALLVNWDVW